MPLGEKTPGEKERTLKECWKELKRPSLESIPHILNHKFY
jgi:hypothetical protein